MIAPRCPTEPPLNVFKVSAPKTDQCCSDRSPARSRQQKGNEDNQSGPQQHGPFLSSNLQKVAILIELIRPRLQIHPYRAATRGHRSRRDPCRHMSQKNWD